MSSVGGHFRPDLPPVAWSGGAHGPPLRGHFSEFLGQKSKIFAKNFATRNFSYRLYVGNFGADFPSKIGRKIFLRKIFTILWVRIHGDFFSSFFDFFHDFWSKRWCGSGLFFLIFFTIFGQFF